MTPFQKRVILFLTLHADYISFELARRSFYWDLDVDVLEDEDDPKPDRTAVRREFTALERDEFIRIERVFTALPLRLVDVGAGFGLNRPPEPACNWYAGEPAPQLGKVSRELIKRAQAAPENSKTIQIAYATPKAAGRTEGVCPDGINKLKLWHDLCAAEMAALEIAWCRHAHHVKLHAYPDDEAIGRYAEEHLRGERWLIANGISLDDYTPDLAVLADGKIVRAMDWGGQYDVERLRKIHRSCAKHGVYYEVF
jgi:hypothetical protein